MTMALHIHTQENLGTLCITWIKLQFTFYIGQLCSNLNLCRSHILAQVTNSRARPCVMSRAGKRRWFRSFFALLAFCTPPARPLAPATSQLSTKSRKCNHHRRLPALTINEIDRLDMHFKMMHRKQKSIKIWPRYRGKQFHTFRIFRVSETNSHFTITEQYCHFVHHVADVSRAVLFSNVDGFWLAIPYFEVHENPFKLM